MTADSPALALRSLTSGGEKALLLGGPGIAGRGGASGDLGGEGRGKSGDVAGAKSETVLGLHAGGGDRALDRVEAVHVRLVAIELAAAGVIIRELVEAGLGDAGEEVGVERDDDVGALEPVLRIDRRTEGCRGCGVGGVAVDRVVLQELRVGPGGLRLLDLRGESWRGDGVGQDVNPLAAVDFLHGQSGSGRPGRTRTTRGFRRDSATCWERSGS